MPRYTQTANTGNATPMRIAITYAATTGSSPFSLALLLVVIALRVEVFAVGVLVQGGSHQSDREKGEPVHGDEHALAGWFAQCLPDQPGWERQEGDDEQEQQVESQEDRIGALEPIGQRGVAEPGRADRQEADHVGDERRPDVQHLVQR